MSTDSGPRDREELVESVDDSHYDLVIIGGGIAGAGVARDGAMRGMDVLLLEQNDFASGTTAGSTRLIHGGLRYLEQYDFHLVFESLRERETLADIAPHLVDPLSFLIPQYDESLPTRIKLRLGMILYDVLSYDKTMPNHSHLSAEELAAREPLLPREGLQGGFVYHDRQCEFPERLVVENVLDADAHGADVLNHAQATDISTNGRRVTGVAGTDTLTDTTFSVDCDAVVNAAGPWVDHVLDDDGALERSTSSALVRPTKGIHLVVPKLTDEALTLPTTGDRIVFVVPWNGLSLIGTTDTPHSGDPADARAQAADVEYLLREVGRYFPDLDAGDILYTYAGVRPLYDEGSDSDPSAVSRRHEVVDHEDPYRGLYSIVGAKITPFRRAAADVTDEVASALGVDAPCLTAEAPLPGARGTPVRNADVSQRVVSHLQELYGTRTKAVLARIDRDEERFGEALCDHTMDVLAQVTLAVEEEYARTLADVMLRRTTVGWDRCEGTDAVEIVAEHMAELLDWDERRQATEIERYQAIVDRRHAYTGQLQATPNATPHADD